MKSMHIAVDALTEISKDIQQSFSFRFNHKSNTAVLSAFDQTFKAYGNNCQFDVYEQAVKFAVRTFSIYDNIKHQLYEADKDPVCYPASFEIIKITP